MTFDITLDTAGKNPLFLQIAARVRSAIAVGQLIPGQRLPSSRALAAQLDIARGTVDAAYALLASEGAIETRRPAGTIVAGEVGRRVGVPEQSPLLFPGARSIERTAPRPFQMGLPALDAFPRKQWASLMVQAVRSIQPTDLMEIASAGTFELRHSIAAYLGGARGITCAPEQVLITSGYQGALALVRSVLIRPGDPVWMEDPGYHMARMAFENAGARVVPVRVDAEGLRVSAGINAAPKAKLAAVTPTHQYPTCVALSLPRRLELLAWAKEAGSWILEDDYDSEFRYVGRPLPSLKSLDRGQRVLYAGSFSKVLFPALRLGYLIVPPELEGAFLRASSLLTCGLPTLEQRVVAAFMRSGQFARHIRRMRMLYAERRQGLAATLRAVFGNRMTVEMAPGGMHLLVRFQGADDDSLLSKRAEQVGLAATALSSLAMAHDCGQGLLISFTNVIPSDAAALVERLMGAVR
jgi:GntR family transcriptional regulator / MocR family aminotransferase